MSRLWRTGSGDPFPHICDPYARYDHEMWWHRLIGARPVLARNSIDQRFPKGNAVPLAGGTDLNVERNILGRVRKTIVAVDALPAFGDDVIELGAGITLR